jgi:hypothetical protein
VIVPLFPFVKNLRRCVDVAPDNLEDLYEEVEDAEEFGPILSRLSSHEAGWLARCIHDKCQKERESFSETIERDLKVCASKFVISQGD